MFVHIIIPCRIYLNEEGEVQLKYKEFHTDTQWRPLHNEIPLHIFRLDARGKQLVPDADGLYAVPPMVTPDYYAKVQLEALTTSVESCRLTMETGQYAWWLQWLKKGGAEKKWEEMADTWRWPLETLGHHVRLGSLLLQQEAEVRRRFVTLKSQTRNINCLKHALKHTVGMYAIYKPKRGHALKIGLIKQATNDEATITRFEEKKDGSWIQSKGGVNVVKRQSVVQLFPKFKYNAKTNRRELPKRLHPIYSGEKVPEADHSDEEAI